MHIRRHISAAGLGLLFLAAFNGPLQNLLLLAADDNRYSYILLVPAISCCLLWLKRSELLSDARFALQPGMAALSMGTLIVSQAGGNLSVTALGAVVASIGIGLLCYGPAALQRAWFPILFLLAAIPLPGWIMDRTAEALQQASAEMTAGLFSLTGIGYAREGFLFHLQTISIEVAKECSGIRSSTSIFVASIFAGQLLLRSGGARLGFALLTIPVVIFKNAVRITGITWLGLHVDAGFFTGALHRYSGIPFSLVALALLLPALWALQRTERVR